MIRTFLLLMLAVVALSNACGDNEVDEAPDKLVFMAGFKPQANLPFVAAYVAQEQGYFAEQDLEVEIRHASSGEHLKLLVAATSTSPLRQPRPSSSDVPTRSSPSSPSRCSDRRDSRHTSL